MHHSIKTIAIGLLMWPLAEIVAFILVAATFGYFTAILMLVLTSLAGVWVLRHLGGGLPRGRSNGGLFTAQAWQDGMAPGLGGTFLLIPGFVSSVLGVVVLFPTSRRALMAGLRRLFTPPQQQRSSPERNDVIDLSPGEWRPLPGDRLPPS